MPRRPSSRKILAGSAAVFVLGLLLFLTFLARVDEDSRSTADELASVASAFLGVAALVVAVAALLLDLAPADSPELDRAAARLAELGVREWTAEIRARRLAHPHPLRLTWHPAGAADGFLVPDDPHPATGLVTAFRALTSRRLVIRGAPGSGKSTLAVLFTVASAADRPASEPVPVLLPAAGWRPHVEELRSWAARWIETTHPELGDADRYGPDAPARLVGQNRVLLVLDGLDELEPGMREEAAIQVGDLASAGGPDMVITCRTEEYDELIETIGRLPLAAELTIDPATVEDTVTFLTGTKPSQPDRWAQVAATLRADPQGPLATALNTPLMISLARSVHGPGGAGPDQLTEFETAEEIEEHLLEGFLTTTYRETPYSRRAGRYLTFLATHLRRRSRSPYLAWWELPRAVPPPILTATVALTIAAIGGLAGALARPIPGSLEESSQLGVALGLIVGVPAGLNATRSLLWRPGRSAPRVAAAVAAAAIRDAAAAVVVLILTSAWTDGSWFDHGRLTPRYLDLGITATMVGAGLSLVTSGLGMWRGAVPARPSWRLRHLPARLLAGLTTGLLLGVPVALATGVAAGIDQFEAVREQAEWSGRAMGAGETLWAGGARIGAWTGALVAVAIGLSLGIGRWLSDPPDDQATVSQRSTFRADWTTSLVIAASAGLAAGSGAALLLGAGLERVAWAGGPAGADLTAGLWAGGAVFVVVLLGSGAPWVTFAAARCWFTLHGRLPWRILAFLEDARGRGVLRQVGPLLQFRHDKLEEHLAHPDPVSPGSSESPGSRRLRTVAATVLSAALVSLVGIGTVPNLRRALSEQIDSADHELAQNLLIRAADLEAESPAAALRFRIAAAELDPGSGSTVELAAYLHARDMSGGASVRQIRELRHVGRWTVVIRADEVAEAWDLSATSPAGVVLAERAVSFADNSPDDRLIGDHVAITTRSGPELWNLGTAAPREVPLPAATTVIHDLTEHYLALGSGPLVTFRDIRDLRKPLATVEADSPGEVDLDDEGWALIVGPGARRRAVDLGDGGRTVEAGRHGLLRTRVSASFHGRTMTVSDLIETTVWDLDSSPPRQVLQQRFGGPRLLVSADGQWVVRHREGTAPEIFALRGTAPVRTELGFSVTSLEFVTEDTLITLDHEGDLRLVTLAPSGPPRVRMLASKVVGFQFVSDARTLATTSADGLRSFIVLTAPAPTRHEAGHSTDPGWLVVGDRAVLPRRDGSTDLWTLRDGPRRAAHLTPALTVTDRAQPWVLAVDDAGRRYLWDVVGSPTTPLPLSSAPPTPPSRLVLYAARTGNTHLYFAGADGIAASEIELGVEASEVIASHDGRWGLLVYDHGSSGRRFPGLLSVWTPDRLIATSPPRDPVRTACGLVDRASTRQEWEKVTSGAGYHRICRAYL